MHQTYSSLNPMKALIWRIVHRDNLGWILKNGLHASSSPVQNPAYVSIGNSDLIGKRSIRSVPLLPNGFLGDYVPFYFTPFSPMMSNIKSGRGGVVKRGNEEIVILVSSMHKLKLLGISYLFTDMHAYYQWANYYSDLVHLDKIDWSLLQKRDFKRDSDDPLKFERYQAEALIHKHLPIQAIGGIVCYTESICLKIKKDLQAVGLDIPTHVRPGWYF